MQHATFTALLIVAAVPALQAGGPAPELTNTLKFNGMEYATFFNTDPFLNGSVCFTQAEQLVDGWGLAENTLDTLYVMQFPWETDFLVIEDGSTFHTGPHSGDRLHISPDSGPDACGPQYPVWPNTYHYRKGCLEMPFWCNGDWGPSGCQRYFPALCNAMVLLSKPLPPSPNECSPADRSQCSPYATCSKDSGNVTCTCHPGFDGDGVSCTDIAECQDSTYYSRCHKLAYCDETPGSFACNCPEGFLGDGFNCANNAFGIRTVLDIAGVGSYSTLQLEALQAAYAMLILQDPSLPSNASVITTLPANFGSVRFGERILGLPAPQVDTQNQIALTVLFNSEAEAQSALDALVDPDWSALGAAGASEGPQVYTWSGGSTSDALQVGPTGLSVDAVYFEHSCMASGCWVVEVTYTAGNDDVSVFYLPKAEASDALSFDPEYSTVDDTWPKSPLDTFSPAEHPCSSMSYNPASSNLPASVTACCIPEFLEMYRPVEAFETSLGAIAGLSLDAVCGVGETDRAIARGTVPSFVSRGQTPNVAENTFALPAAPGVLGHGIFVDGTFKGMNLSRIDHKTVADSYVGVYKAVLRMDEVELRTLAGQLRGTVGVEHTVDTFVGMANFGPTGGRVLDTGAVQVNIHLEKTDFFSVSTHGTNDYTFLEYVNLRLVAIYNEDADFSGSGESADRTVRTDSNNAAHYLQVTFTLGSQYEVNDNSGLIPLDSVRAGRADFLDSATMEHKCTQWLTAGFPRLDDFKATLQQGCAPSAAMCASPSSIPDSFVSFNVPLGVDFYGEPSSALNNVVFVSMVISAVDTAAKSAMSAPNDGEEPWQMKTTLSASIPVVEGGINIFCDGFTAKTDLKDVADVDIVVGSARSAEELTRVKILTDIASTQLAAQGPSEIDGDSIEAGLVTLVLKGNASYFDLPGNGEVSIELEDVVAVHIMEEDGDGSDGAAAAEVLRMISAPPSDNHNASGLDTDGYLLNEAVAFRVDRASQRAHLEPTDALLALCPWNPTRPRDGNSPLATCLTRRDVFRRGYPARLGSVSTAMEICAAASPHTDPCDDDHADGCCGSLDAATLGPESLFFGTMLGSSSYAHELALDFAKTIDKRYALNGRFRRAYWINPAYEWSPTQTGGVPIFLLSQKVFILALVTLDENIASAAGELGPAPSFAARRMLLQSQPIDPLQAQGVGAAAGQAAMSYSVTPASMMAQAFEVPRDHVASFKVSVQLKSAEACSPIEELQASLRNLFDDYLSAAASEYKTVQLTSLRVDLGEEQCGRRALRRQLLSTFSTATATASMVVVFAEGPDPPSFNQALFASMPGINAVETLSLGGAVQDPDDGRVYAASGTPEPEGGSSSSNLLVAGIAGGAGALVLILVAGFLLWRRRSAPHESCQSAVQAITVNQLKGELSLAAAPAESRADQLKRELASGV